ncbi:hypothetical protein FWG86_00315 [Candidatus Saccharibacteria bacterium]|nr:hypothetical protein [Candidatus Saccharibacteria bacterium]
MKLRLGILGVAGAILGVLLMAAPAEARSFSIAGPFANYSAVPSEYKYNGGLLTWQNCTNNGFDNNEVFDWIHSTIGARSSTPIQVDITHNSAMNWKAGFTGSCEIVVMYGESLPNSTVYPLLKNGQPTGYGYKQDCGNLVRYDLPPEGWKSNGETEIFSTLTGWTKAHPRGAEMPVKVGDMVRWRHRVNITDRQGGAEAKFKVTTVSKKGTSVVQLAGGSANWTDHELTVSAAQQNTGWQERTWTVPTDAEDGDIYCQFWEWTPNEGGGTGKGSSESNREQCVKVLTDPNDWMLNGTTEIRPCGGAWGTSDIQVAPNGCAEWRHTLTKVGAVAFPGQVNFEQRRTEGNDYSGRQSGSRTGLPATNPFAIPLGSTGSFSYNVPEGQRICQNLGWTVPADAEKNGQTARLCATTLVVGSSTEYLSRLRACAVKVRSIAGNTVENCTPWVDLNNTPQEAPVNFAKTQDMLYFRYNLEKIAQYQSRRSVNYRPLSVLQSLNDPRTICATNPTEAKDCIPLGPNLTYTPPTTPGGSGTLNPSWLATPMEPWNRAADNCVLTPRPGSLKSSFNWTTLAPSSCTSTETQLSGGSNFEYRGTGHKVVNADLGVVKADLTQKISLKDAKIVVHQNNDTHQYKYRYKKKNSGTCASASWCSGGCASCTPPIPCSPGSCNSYTVNYFGAGSVSGTSCRYGCTGVDGTQDADGTFDENQHTWIEVMPDGPIEATASFAVPYNYNIVPQLNFLPANAQRIQIGGTNLSFSASFAVQPRTNTELNETYATATRPGTRWQITEFYLAPNVSNPNWADTLSYNGTALPCSAYSGAAFDCNITGGTGQLNTQSESSIANLQGGSTFSVGLTSRVVKDLEIGTKFCVSAAVMDDSSHTSGATGYVSGNGYTDTMRGEWKMTKPECVVVGKMPMANVIAGGLYSDGMIEGAIFEKQPQPQTGITNSTSPCPVGTGSMCAFGSWGEYEVVSNSAVYTFASGAALGVGAGGVPFGLTTATTLLSGNLMTGSCQIALLTFANSGCSPTSTTAPLGNMGGADTAHGMARNIRHRYSNYNDSYTAAERAARGIQVVDGFGGGSISNYNQRMNYLKSSGSITIEASTIQPGRTVVIDTPGTVTINGNITLSNGPYTDISQIPQVLIFAGSININSNVSQVDAWLLAGLNGGSGSINTCAGASGVSSVAALDGSKCTTRLAVNGPVMASRVALHRTHGAGIGMPASARPAEVFYLSPATYLWAYNQSSNLSQAYLTYAREVAPRF